MQALEIGPADPSSTAEWINMRCPLAPWTHSRGTDRVASFGIRCDDKGQSFCNCFTCKYTESFASLAYKLGRHRNRDYTQIGREIEREEFVGSSFVPVAYRDSVLPIEMEGDIRESHEKDTYPDPALAFRYESAIGHPYLAARNIDVRTTIELGLRYDPSQRRILFPVYDKAGHFRGFSGRRVDPAWGVDDEGVPIERDGSIYLKVRDYFGLPKSRVLLGEHAIRNDAGTPLFGTVRYTREAARRNSQIVLVEGLFDYAYFKRLGIPNVLGILGSSLARDPTRANTIESFGMPVVLFVDNDKPGVDARDKIVKRLFGKVGLLDVFYPDGYDEADPASLPPSVVNSMLRESVLISSPPPEPT